MASLLETSSSTADFKAAMETAERLSSLLCGGYGETDNLQQSPLISLDDDLWKELYLLPTPPLSPESLNTVVTTKSTPEQATDPGSSLYMNMMEYDQMMDVLEEAERVLTDSQQSLQQDLLLQDCMWSGGNCDGLLTNTISPNNITNTATTPTIKSNDCSDAMGDVPLCDQNVASPIDDNSNSDNQEPDCVEPAAVFPVLRAANDKSSKTTTSSFNRSTSARSSLSSSESEEEIDVVTVERDFGGKTSTLTNGSHRHSTVGTKKHLGSSTRHSSGGINSPPLRKKRHTKRLSRRASEDGMESDEEARRASHNVLERKRRNDLKNSFDILRGGIPELEENLRAPKVVILRKAVEYIQSLQTTDQKTKVDYNKEQTRHKKLTERLTFLKNLYSI